MENLQEKNNNQAEAKNASKEDMQIQLLTSINNNLIILNNNIMTVDEHIVVMNNNIVTMNGNLSYCDDKIDLLIDINANNSNKAKTMVRAFRNSKKKNNTKFQELQEIERPSFKINESNGSNEIKENKKSSPKDDNDSDPCGNHIYENKSLKESSKEQNSTTSNKSMDKAINNTKTEMKKEKGLKHANKNIKTAKKSTKNCEKMNKLQDEPKNSEKNTGTKKNDKTEDIPQSNPISNQGKGNTNHDGKKANNALTQKKTVNPRFIANQSIKMYPGYLPIRK